MALLTGLHDWLSRAGSDCVLMAATVDHQLRAQSAAEARQVAAFCAARAVAHTTLVWDHQDITSGVQQKARMARYELLGGLASAHNVDLIVTGHTLDDQRETIAMRAKRGEGEGRGDAGIAPASCHARAVWFARPFLGVGRQALRHYLQQHNVGWFDDPSNDNESFERVRVRKRGVGGVEVAPVCDAQKRRQSDCAKASTVLGDAALVPRLERDCATMLVDATTHPGWPVALAAVLSLVGEKVYFPNAGALQQAVDFVATQATSARQNNAKLTLHGCLLTHRDGQITVTREARHCAGGFFGMDRLVPSFDVALANALYSRLGEAPLPDLPFDYA